MAVAYREVYQALFTGSRKELSFVPSALFDKQRFAEAHNKKIDIFGLRVAVHIVEVVPFSRKNLGKTDP